MVFTTCISALVLSFDTKPNAVKGSVRGEPVVVSGRDKLFIFVPLGDIDGVLGGRCQASGAMVKSASEICYYIMRYDGLEVGKVENLEEV